MFRYLKNILLKTVNCFVPKRRNTVFVYPIANCKVDNYDLINYSSDTTLSFLNYWMKQDCKDVHSVYLVVFHPDRMDEYKKYVSECKHIHFYFILHPSCSNGLKKKVLMTRLMLARFKSRIWIFEPVPSIRSYALKNQSQLCLSYFASCKSDYDYESDFRNFLRAFPIEKSVHITATSILDAAIKSAAYNVPYHCFNTIGLARNDLIGSGLNRDAIDRWLNSIPTYNDSKIILFAPTFRDYETEYDVEVRSIWGNGYCDDVIDNYLSENNIIVIAKLHPWQNKKVIAEMSGNIVCYPALFDFSYYDLMTIADLLITDYSSIGFDWLLTGKPIIYNLYDYDEYSQKRGLAIEPYEHLCAGVIAKNTNELLKAITFSLTGVIDPAAYERVKDLILFNQNHDSCKHVLDMVYAIENIDTLK